MKDLFTIQTESGQLWLDIKAQLDAKDAAHALETAAKDAQIAAKDTEKAAAVEAAKIAIQTNLDALVQAAETAHASGNLDAIAAVIEQAKSYTTAARRAKLEADIAAAQAAATEAAAKLAALNP